VPGKIKVETQAVKVPDSPAPDMKSPAIQRASPGLAQKAGAVEPAVPAEFGVGRTLKTTVSICPVCLEKIEARVMERGRQVWMDKTCADHGSFSALLNDDVAHYYVSDIASAGESSCCGTSCSAPLVTGADAPAPAFSAAPWANHSCTVLIEIIERCNLSCPTCFAGSSPQHDGLLELAEFKQQVNQLADGGKRAADMIQLSGGEPTIHPELMAMIEYLFESGFSQVCINSNGIKLANPEFCKRLAECMGRYPSAQIYIYLQFDGFEDQTNEKLRGRADLLRFKQQAMQNCHQAGLKVHPVMTLTRGINEHEVGDFVRLGMDLPWLKNVVIQPAMYSGRYDNPKRSDRMTLADTISMICSQFGVFSQQDFTPIPCSDPNCFSMAVALRTESGLVPISRYFPRFETWETDEGRAFTEKLTDTINGPLAMQEAMAWITSGAGSELLDSLSGHEVDQLLDAVTRMQASSGENHDLWNHMLTISIKPFMDAWNYDQDRIDKCCVHILDPQGNPVSFCEYNAIHRPQQTSRPGSQLPASLPLRVENS